MDAVPAPFALPRPIVLVGLMGAGKSTVGRRLAAALSLTFVDSDNEIVEAAGCSIADIFESYGEAIFRDLEQRVLLRLVSNVTPSVIATGGGAFLNPAIRCVIKEKAISVWLKAELPVLLDRVSRRDTRPLLKSGDKGAILSKLMADRYPIYAEADLTIDSNAGPHETVVKNILSMLKKRSAHA
ncbi:MAG: shikimate kinase [Pseudomonadota bacterium]|nr:shikimate kinase [Pseudomonadota bacterium]MDE3037636.1 shikimate kinase [Pseudomonadota bacterium]